MSARMFLKWAVLLCAAFANDFARAEAPRVIVSIKPLHSLVASVMEGVAVPEVLLKGSASVHAYALRPSEAEALRTADVVFWIGPAFEVFLEKPIAALAGKARIIAVMSAPGMNILSARDGGVWEDHHTSHSATRSDGHIWLDPHSAKALVAEIAQQLAAVDQPHAAQYRANALTLQARLDALDAALKAQLAPFQNSPFVVFHDAYQYFENRYNLRAVGSVTVSADRTPGARRILEIKDKLASLGAGCVFAEPQFTPALINTLAGDGKVKTGILDPEGSTLPPGPDLYATLMRNLAGNLAGCLSAS